MPVTSDTLMKKLGEVLIDPTSVPTVNKLKNNTIQGGWEVWLQVEYAAFVLDYINKSEKNANATVVREKYYNPQKKAGQKTDLFFEAAGGGVQLWVELKTQKTGTDKTIFTRFYEDINKIISIWRELKFKRIAAPVGGIEKNILIAMAVVIHPEIWAFEHIVEALKETEKNYNKLKHNISIYPYIYADNISENDTKWSVYDEEEMYENIRCVILVGKLN